MNNILKSQIVLRFGTQTDFAVAADERAEKVSRVVRGRETLSSDERQKWATLLRSDINELWAEEAKSDET